MKPCLPWLAMLLLAASAAAQTPSPCFANLVPNGDFSLILPPWSITGAATSTYVAAAVDNVSTSRCIQLAAGGLFHLTSPAAAPIPLGQQAYELSFDMRRGNNICRMDLGLVPAGGGNRISVAQVNYVQYPNVSQVNTRVAVQFTVATAGSYLVDLQFGDQNTYLIDNVTLHEARPLYFNIWGDARRTGVPTSFSVTGSPNQAFAVLVAFRTTAPIVIPTFQYDLLIGPPPELSDYVPLTNLNSNGVYTSSFTVPPIAAGLTLWWQPVALTPTGEFGCADMIAYP